jgi:hypothetical protein
MSASIPTSDDVADHFASFLRARFGVMKAGAKRLARLAGNADPRAAKNWLDGSNLPQLRHTIEMMAADQEVEEEILALVRSRREALCNNVASKSSQRSVAGMASASARPANPCRNSG